MLFEIIYVIIGAIVAGVSLITVKSELSEIKENLGFDKFQTFVTLAAVTAGLIVTWPLVVIAGVIANARGKS